MVPAMLAAPDDSKGSRMPDDDTIPAHGGTLVDLLVAGEEAERLTAEASNFPKVRVSDREVSDLEMLAVGALSPLTGFQGEDEYRSILETMHLSSGLPWTIIRPTASMETWAGLIGRPLVETGRTRIFGRGVLNPVM